MDQSLSWHDARDRCKQVGEEYDLVGINDREENQFLKDRIRSQFSGTEFWIGMKENDNKDGFTWVDGSDLTFDDWKGGEPDSVIEFNLFGLFNIVL